MAVFANVRPASLRARVAWGVVTAVLVGMTASTVARSDTFVDRVLRKARFSVADLRVLAGGGAVVKTLQTAARQELAYFGAVAINVPPERFLERFGDIARFERGPGVPQIGVFSALPRLEDVAALTLPPADISALAACRPGSCALKLSAASMTRFRDGVDWSSPAAPARAQDVARGMVVELVRAYQRDGDAALGQYVDGEGALSVAGEFRALLAGKDPLPVPVPDLLGYLNDYPRHRPPAVTDLFYWSVVNFGLKPTLRVNHVVIYPMDEQRSGVSHVIAIKQLYAAHYFRSALELRFLVRSDRPQERRGMDLLTVTRSRIDGTGGMSGAFLRPVISRRSRSGVRGYLAHMKRQVELAESSPPGGLVEPCSATGDLRVCVGR